MFISSKIKKLAGPDDIIRMAKHWYDESDDVVACTGVGEADFDVDFDGLGKEGRDRVISAFCRACSKAGVSFVGGDDNEED